MTVANYCVLVISIVVPLALLWKQKHAYLVFWISFTMMVEIFNSLSLVSITATKMTGLLLVPYAAKHCFKIFSTKPGTVLLFLTMLLVSLGIFYGFISPWPDYTGARTLRYLPQGRSILYLGTVCLELVVVIYLGMQLRDERNFRFLITGVLAGGVLSGIGMILERFLHFDFFYFATGWDPRPLAIRQRGFNYEPRGAGYTSVVALLTFLLPQRVMKPVVRFICMFLVYCGFYFSASVSAIILLLAGFMFLAFFHWKTKGTYGDEPKQFLRNALILGVIALGFASPFNKIGKIRGTTAWEDSVDGKRRAYVGEGFHLPVLEPFDDAAARFFVRNPRHLLLGTGPGLISLPASSVGRIDSLPHIGMLLQISNYGLLGLAGWLSMVLFMFSNMARSSFLENRENRLRFLLFLFVVPLYLLQAKIFYIVALGVGFASYSTVPVLARAGISKSDRVEGEGYEAPALSPVS